MVSSGVTYRWYHLWYRCYTGIGASNEYWISFKRYMVCCCVLVGIFKKVEYFELWVNI